MKIIHDLDLTKYNSYHLKSVCRVAYFPDNESDVVDFLKANRSYILLGSGHNVILSQPYYEQPFLIFNGNYNNVSFREPAILEAEAGVWMMQLSELALEQSLSGVEVFYDIPSSLGGAIVMNAGAGGEEIKDLVVKVRYYDVSAEKIAEVEQHEISFNYRDSFFQRHSDKVILKAWLKLRPADRVEIEDKMRSIKTQRWLKQPRDFPNAGSVFKRPKGYYVGAMIDKLGLKGYRIGGAMVSEKHGGFIVNVDNATGDDIIALINYIKHRVYEKYKIDLEVEQRIL